MSLWKFLFEIEENDSCGFTTDLSHEFAEFCQWLSSDEWFKMHYLTKWNYKALDGSDEKFVNSEITVIVPPNCQLFLPWWIFWFLRNLISVLKLQEFAFFVAEIFSALIRKQDLGRTLSFTETKMPCWIFLTDFWKFFIIQIVIHHRRLHTVIYV